MTRPTLRPPTARPPLVRAVASALAPVLAAGLAAGLLVLGLAWPAQAEAYRYWGYYYSEDGAWTFAMAGPADTIPADGAVEGWRFAVTGEASERFPRAEPTFDTLCAGVEPAEGSKRVGLVVDYGTTQDAPDGEAPPAARGACAQVPEDATGADVLAAVADLRLGDGGFVCGVDGYPAAGCGDQIEGDAPTGPEEPVDLVLPTAAATSSSSWLPVVVGVAVVALVATVALLITRRRRTDEQPGA